MMRSSVFLSALVLCLADGASTAMALPVEKATIEAPDGRMCEVSAAPSGEYHDVSCDGELLGQFKMRDKEGGPTVNVAPPPPQAQPEPQAKPDAQAQAEARAQWQRMTPQEKMLEARKRQAAARLEQAAKPSEADRQRMLRSVANRYYFPATILTFKVTANDGRSYWIECWGNSYSDIEVYEHGKQIGRIHWFEDGTYSGGFFTPPEGGNTMQQAKEVLKAWVDAGGLAAAREKQQAFTSTFVPALLFGQPKTSVDGWSLGAGYQDIHQRLQQCFEKSLKQEPKSRGGATMELNVSSAGTVTHVAFNRDGAFPTVFMACAESAANGVTFKAPGKDASVDIYVGITDKDPRSP
jgi:hypothetical protein